MMNTYYIVRHGETVYQTKKEKIIYPWPEVSPLSLTNRGVKEIKTLAKKLKKAKVDELRSSPRCADACVIDLIYSSDIFRARQTAEIIAKELGLKVNFDSRLRDINLGIYHGRKKEEFYRDFPRVFPLRFIKRPPGGESWQDVQKRMLNFLKKIDKKQKGKNILIVSHGDPLWLLEGAIKGWNLEKFSKTSKPNYIQPGELRKL